MHTTTNRKQPGTTEARASSRVATAIAILLLLSSVARGQILLELDLSEPDQAKRWRPTHDVGELERRFDGLHVPVTGPDPYLRGPVVDLPGGIPLWLHLEVEPDRSGSVQIFWWGVGQHPTEERSVRVPVRRGEVNRRRVSIPALGEGTALRFDPPSTAKACRLKRIAFERRLVHPEPEWEVPALRPARSGDQAVVSGAIAGSLDRAGLSLEVEEQLIAVLAGPLPIVWMDDDETLHEVDTKAGRTIVRNRADANVVDQDWRDDRGTAWHLRRILTAGPIAGSLALSWELTANQDRELL
ncbi:MAG: hypothetical protein KDB53_15270, partial [Planctomycetes bacterium]|nr:hypothetical protein [Planctomycetota bacterium]